MINANAFYTVTLKDGTVANNIPGYVLTTYLSVITTRVRIEKWEEIKG